MPNIKSCCTNLQLQFVKSNAWTQKLFSMQINYYGKTLFIVCNFISAWTHDKNGIACKFIIIIKAKIYLLYVI